MFNADKVALSLPQLQADLIDLTPQDPLNLKDMSQIKMRIRNGEVILTNNTISSFLNDAIKKTPVKKLDLHFEPNNQLAIKGALTFLKLPFQVDGPLRLEADNTVSYTPTKLKFLGVPITGLFKIFGMELGQLLKLKDPEGRFGSRGNQIFFAPTKFASAPVIEGQLREIKTDAGFLSLYFGDVRSNKPLNLPPNNFARITGGDLLVGDKRLVNPDLLLTDKTPNDPFEFTEDSARNNIILAGDVVMDRMALWKMIAGTAGGGDFKPTGMTLTNEGVKFSGEFKGFRVGFLLTFSKNDKKELVLTAHQGETEAGIPIPDKMLAGVLEEQLKGAKRVGNSFVLDESYMEGTFFPNLKEVVHTPDALTLKS